MDIYSWILTSAIVAGQFAKLPLSGSSGPNLLDTVVGLLCIVGTLKLKLTLKKPPLYIKAALIFILIALLSLLITPLKLTVPEYSTSFLYTVRFFIFIFLGWLIYCGAFPDLAKNIHRILITSGVLLSTLGIFQLLLLPDLGFLTLYGWDPHYFRTVSTFLDPNFLGSFLVLTLLLLKNKYLFALIFLALMTTFSRGAYLAFLLSFLTLSYLNKSIKLGIVTIMLFLGLLTGFFTYQQLVAAPRGVDRSKSAEFRQNSWQQGWQLFQTHPILGVGFNAYKHALKAYNFGDEQFLKSHGASTNDSSLLYVAATTGTAGLICFSFLLFSLAKTSPTTFAGLLGVLAQSFFANTLFYPPLLLWLILISLVHKK